MNKISTRRSHLPCHRRGILERYSQVFDEKKKYEWKKLELAGMHIKIFAEPFEKDTKCQLQILPHLLTSQNLNGSSCNVLAFDSKKNLQSESWWRDSKRDKWYDLSKWKQGQWSESSSQFKLELFQMTSCHVHCNCGHTLVYAHPSPFIEAQMQRNVKYKCDLLSLATSILVK